MTFNEEQKYAIEWFRGPLLVLGTPGSGKTTVILHRVRELVVRYGVIPREILVITFTKAAAQSMQQRYEAMEHASGGVRFSTFHSFYYWIIRTAYKLPADSVLSEEERYQWIRGILTKISPEYGSNDEILTSVLRQIDALTNDMIDLSDYYSTDLPAEEFRELVRQFQARKKAAKKLDFNDMMQMCYDLLCKRKDILERIRDMYPFVMVDEYQDTNRIQYEILKLIVHPRDNFFAVGDDDQSIYGFRGARPDIMLSFGKEFPEGERITLSVNYRCPGAVTSLGDTLIRNNRRRYAKTLSSAKGDSGKDTVLIRTPKNDREEYGMIRDSIRDAVRKGIPYEEIAVLFRTNRDPRRLSFYLRDAAIPYRLRDVLPNLFNHPAVTPVMDYLAFAAGDYTRSRFLRIMNKPVRYIRREMLSSEHVDLIRLTASVKGQAYLEKNLQKLRADLQRLRTLPPAAAINYIRKGMRYESWLLEEAERRALDAEEQLDMLDELQSMAEPYQNTAEFFQYAEAYQELLKEENRKNDPKNAETRGVQLMTLHSAKGLEFREVHIMDCVEGSIPHKRSKTPAAIEEERRMFYVGITRASERLFLYAPKMIGKKAARQSPFLTELCGKDTAGKG